MALIKMLLVTLIPVSGCVTGYVRDTEQGTWPHAYRDQEVYYVLGWKERFIVKPDRVMP